MWVRYHSAEITTFNKNVLKIACNLSSDARRRIARERVSIGADLLHQQAQKKSDIGHNADAFDRASIGQLRDNGRIDVHTHKLYACRSHISDADAVKHGT